MSRQNFEGMSYTQRDRNSLTIYLTQYYTGPPWHPFEFKHVLMLVFNLRNSCIDFSNSLAFSTMNLYRDRLREMNFNYTCAVLKTLVVVYLIANYLKYSQN